MDLLEASTDNRKAQSNGPDTVYAPLHPLTRSWEVPRHHVTMEKSLVKVLLVKLLKEQLWDFVGYLE